MCSSTHEPVHNGGPAFLPRLRRMESGAQRNPATPSSSFHPSLCVNVAADGRSLQGLAPSSGRWHGDEAEGHQEDRGEPSEASSVDERVREKNNEEKIPLIPATLSPALPHPVRITPAASWLEPPSLCTVEIFHHSGCGKATQLFLPLK